jgi:hypothetical protein
MKQYRVARSIFGSLGSLKRRAVLLADDPRIVNNPTAVEDLVKRKLLIEESKDDDHDEELSAAPAKGKSGRGKAG